MSEDEYSEVDSRVLEKLWPVETDGRPQKAWRHARCGLIVTNRAEHLPISEGGRYPCPEVQVRKYLYFTVTGKVNG